MLIAHQAAWGLDPGATRFVLERVIALRDAGAAVLYISSELEEVLDDRRPDRGDGRRRFRWRSCARAADMRPDRSVDVGARGMTRAGASQRPMRRAIRPAAGCASRVRGWPAWSAIAAALSVRYRAAALIALSGHNPLAAFAAMATGAVGSPHQIGVALNRTTPYLLAGSGVAMCFRAGIINIGAEGQIALGGVGAAAVALRLAERRRRCGRSSRR